MEIMPGLSVRIVVESHHREGGILVMDSTVYEVSGDTLVLAQTDPLSTTGWPAGRSR